MLGLTGSSLALVFILAAVAHAATATSKKPAVDRCALQTTWFPQNYENIAVPAPFRLSSQLAAGWSGKGDPMKVVTEGTSGVSVPFRASHYLLELGPVPSGCFASATRAHCQVATVAAADTVRARPSRVEVVRRAMYQVSWRLNSGPINYVKLTDQWGLTTPFIDLDKMDNVPDGEYCLNATATILKGSGILAIDGKNFTAPCANMSTTKTWCFTKMLGVPRATITFHSCRPQLLMKLVNPFPAPSLAQAQPPVMLGGLRVVVFGNVSMTNIKDKRVGQFGLKSTFKGLADWWNPELPLVMEADNLLDGQWQFKVQVSYASMMPSLVNLTGKFVYPDNMTTYHGALLGDGTIFNVNVKSQQPTISRVTCKKIVVPGITEVAWSMVTGAGGSFRCFVDGMPLSNTRSGGCVSPLKVPLLDQLNHALEIHYTNLCGLQHQWEFAVNANSCTKTSEANDMDNLGESSDTYPPPPLTLAAKAIHAPPPAQPLTFGSPLYNTSFDPYGGTLTDTFTMGPGDGLTLSGNLGSGSGSSSRKSIRNLVLVIVVAVVVAWLMWSDFLELRDTDPMDYLELPDL